MTTIDTTNTQNEQIDDQAVVLTELAAKEIGRIIDEQDLDREKVRLRVGVKGGGCSGFSYILDLTETVKDSDEVFVQHGVTMVVDPKSLLYLGGTIVDFKDEIMGRGFVFTNPNATTNCGCGSSFAV